MRKNLKSSLNQINIPIPSNINYNWNLGFLLGICLAIQIISGIFLSFHYHSFMERAFERVINISRNVNRGWLIRYVHINGASLFFVLIYFHIAKNILIISLKLQKVWNVGIIIFLILIGTAFLGYVLPWGQISFWAATVITNLLSAIPFWGILIVNWVWGRFSVDAPTLTRFFSIHFLLPFILVFLVLVHIIFLHTSGSSRSISIKRDNDKRNFYPLFIIKDVMGILVILTIFSVWILISPFMLVDPENFIPANPIITPIHIQPEWYFLFAYAILRSIPNKLGGVLALLIRILIFLLKRFWIREKKNFKFQKFVQFKFFIFCHCFIILSWIGINQVEYPFDLIGIFYTVLYFILAILL